MPSKELELSIAIGGYLSPELGRSINQVQKTLDSLGLAGTETQQKLDAIGRIDQNQLALEKMAMKLRDAIIKEKVASEALERAQQRGGKVQDSLTRKKAAASATVAKLLKSTQDLSAKNIRYKQTVTELYGPINKLKESEESLRKTRQQMLALRQKALELEASIEKRTQSMYSAQMRITAASAIASRAQVPLEAAMEGERLNFELSTVINVDEKGKNEALAKAREVGNELARAGYASFAETQDIQYALNSAGLTADLSSNAVKAVTSVSKVTKGEMAQVGEVMATVYNNLGDRMAGTEAERFNRIGELLTKTQFKYQIRDFGQLGESMQKGALGIKQYNAQLEQSIAALGMLNSAGLQGGEAGTAYYAMLRGFLKTAQEIPSVLKKTSDGELDVVASLRELNRGMVKMDEVQRAQFMSEMFGDEGAAALVPLLDKLDELEKGYKDVRDSSHGIVDKNMAEYLKLTSTRISAARESAYSLARTLGGALAPAAQTGFDGLNKVAEVLGAFAEANPTLTKIIALSTAALIGVNLLAAGFLYLSSGFSTLVTGVGRARQFIRLLRAAMAGLEVATMKGGKAATALVNSWEAMKSLALLARLKAAALAQWGWNAALAAGRGLISVGRVLAYKAALLAVSAATKAWTAAQWLLNVALTAGRWLFDAGKLLAYRAAMLLVSAATKGWAIVQGVLNAAMLANPIGIVIAAIGALIGVIALLYKKFEWVRNIIDATWGALKRAGSAVASFFGFGSDETRAPALPTGSAAAGSAGIGFYQPTAFAGGVITTGTGWQVPAFAEGGYVPSKTIAMVGEKGPEMVIPLTNRATGMKRLAQAARILTGNKAAVAASRLVQIPQVSEPLVQNPSTLLERINLITNNSNSAVSSDDKITINFSPTITVQGGSRYDRQDIASALATAKEELRRMLEDILHEQKRLSLA